MPFREIERNKDADKASGVGKLSEVDTKPKTTADQRLWRNTRFFKAVGIGLTLGMAGMGGALADQSRSLKELAGSDNAPGLFPAFDQQVSFTGNSLSEGYVPSAKDMEQYQAFLEKMNNPPFYFNPPKDPQAMPSEETSQAAMETPQGKQDKGKDSLS